VCKYSIFLPNAKEMAPKFRQPPVSWCRRQVCGRSCGRAAFPPADARARVPARLAVRTDDKIVASGEREVVVCCPKCLYL
jgi:hypothetical protein